MCHVLELAFFDHSKGISSVPVSHSADRRCLLLHVGGPHIHNMNRSSQLLRPSSSALSCSSISKVLKFSLYTIFSQLRSDLAPTFSQLAFTSPWNSCTLGHFPICRPRQFLEKTDLFLIPICPLSANRLDFMGRSLRKLFPMLQKTFTECKASKIMRAWAAGRGI